MLGPGGADGPYDFQGEADAVVEAATILVGAVVGERRKEFVEEVAVGGVKFDEIESGCEGAMSSSNEVGDDLVHPGAIKGCGDGERFVEANGGRSDRLPAAFRRRDGTALFPWDRHAGFAAGVSELGSSVGAVLVEEGCDSLEFRDVLVFPDAEIAGSDAGFGTYGVSFRNDEGSAADGPTSEVDEVPVVGEAVDRGVFAHGGDDDAVG